jgi:predicted MFS family arabinose efflux permease
MRTTFIKWLLIVIGYAVILGFVVPWLMSQRDATTVILGMSTTIILLVVLPGLELINTIERNKAKKAIEKETTK